MQEMQGGKTMTDQQIKSEAKNLSDYCDSHNHVVDAKAYFAGLKFRQADQLKIMEAHVAADKTW